MARRGPGAGPPLAIYSRAMDIPWAQRKAHRADIAACAPAIPAVGVAYPALRYLRGAGPYTSWHLVLAALVVDPKVRVYLEFHVRDRRPANVYLTPWDATMDTARELRVYVRRGRVVAIAPWDHAHVHAWLDAATDEELAMLARHVASYVERRLAPVVAAHAPWTEGHFSADVLVEAPTSPDDAPPAQPTLKLVELGPFGRFQAAGSTLFHWLEEDVFGPCNGVPGAPGEAADGGATGDPGPIEFRVLAPSAVPSVEAGEGSRRGRGEALSKTRPMPVPDMLRI